MCTNMWDSNRASPLFSVFHFNTRCNFLFFHKIKMADANSTKPATPTTMPISFTVLLVLPESSSTPISHQRNTFFSSDIHFTFDLVNENL